MGDFTAIYYRLEIGLGSESAVRQSVPLAENAIPFNGKPGIWKTPIRRCYRSNLFTRERNENLRRYGLHQGGFSMEFRE